MNHNRKTDRMQTTESPTLDQIIITIRQATNFTPIVPLIDCEFATILNVFDGETFTLYLDDLSSDQRIVLSYHKGHRSMSSRELSGFDSDKHAWTNYGRGGYIELSTLAGKKKLTNRFEELASQHMLHKRPRHMTLYRKHGEWTR